MLFAQTENVHILHFERKQLVISVTFQRGVKKSRSTESKIEKAEKSLRYVKAINDITQAFQGSSSIMQEVVYL
jgi:hypothetical protein